MEFTMRLNGLFRTLCFLGAINFIGSGAAQADEGMWLLNQFPAKMVKERYGFEPTTEWLHKVQLASAKLGGGCSGSFVSGQGLVMTNHHCAHECIEQLSTPEKNLVQDGFIAHKLADEKKCPAMEVNRLVGIIDVTKEVLHATKNLEGAEFQAARKAKIAELETACSQGQESVRCDVVTLFHGGLYHLYKYERYQDVRLVFAPEFKIAFFGGDPDNFMFPRYDLDLAFLRVYKNQEAIKNENFFSWGSKPLKNGDITFVTGHPGRTNRLSTTADLAFTREISLPDSLMYNSENRGFLTEYQNRGGEAVLSSHDLLFGIENSLKVGRGKLEALNDQKLIRAKTKEEEALRKQVPNSFAAIDKAYSKWREFYTAWRYLEVLDGNSKFLYIAKILHRSGVELSKPNAKRFREFTEAKLPQLKLNLNSEAKIYTETETVLLKNYFVKLREMLSPDHELIKRLFKEKSPGELASYIVSRTKLGEISKREELFGNQDKISKSEDPLLKLVAQLDAFARPLRERYENEVESVLIAEHEKIAQARFKVYGTKSYPDATGTLRISIGQVKGYFEGGREVQPFTFIKGTFDRATGYEPFQLPASWITSAPKINQDVHFNMVTSNDIIGGNSGSPVINREREVVGLIFDGNIQSLGGDYYFDAQQNRAVSVVHTGIAELMKNVYKADSLIKELKL
jgi:hypothetical protein